MSTVVIGKALWFGDVASMESIAARLVLPAGAVRAKVWARQDEFVTVSVMFASGVFQHYYLSAPPNSTEPIMLWNPEHAILRQESALHVPRWRFGSFTVGRLFWDSITSAPSSPEARALLLLLAHIRYPQFRESDGRIRICGESPLFPPASEDEGDTTEYSAVFKKCYGTNEDGEECHTVEFAGFVPVDQQPNP